MPARATRPLPSRSCIAGCSPSAAREREDTWIAIPAPSHRPSSIAPATTPAKYLSYPRRAGFIARDVSLYHRREKGRQYQSGWREAVMTLRIGSRAPDFEARSTEGAIRFHDWIG